MEETEEKAEVVTESGEQNGTPAPEPAAPPPSTTATTSSAAASTAAGHWATAGLRLRAQLDAEVERLYTLYRDKRAFRNSAFAIGLPEDIQNMLTGFPEEIQSKLSGLPEEIQSRLSANFAPKRPSFSDIVQSSASKILQKRFANTSRFVVSSKVWLNTIPTRDCDVLMTFPAKTEDSTLMWVLSRLRSQTPELAVHVRHHSHTGFYGFYLTANYENLLKGAEELAIRKPVKQEFGGGMKEFVFEDQEYFEGVEDHATFLASQERQSIVKNMLYNLRAVEGDTLHKIRFLEGQAIVPILMSKGVIQKVLPLHNNDDLTELRVNWVQAFFRKQPLEKICAYFGVKIAMYFAYLGHYTKSLCFPAFLGIFFWLLSGHNQDRDDLVFVLFALINVVWSTLYLEQWKRRSAEHAYNWGTLDREDELLVEPRPLFTGDLEKSAVTGRLEPVYPAWKRNLFRYFISVPIICVCLSVVFITMWMIFHFQDMINLEVKKGDYPAFFKFFPKILLAVCIGILDDIYKKIAFWLNDMENYRLDDAYENHLIIKLVLFQFVNSFLSLFYIAFYLRDMDRLRDQLAALLITRQVIGNIKEALIPYIIGKAKLYRIGYKMTEGMSPDTLDRQMKEMTGEKDDTIPEEKEKEKEKEKEPKKEEEVKTPEKSDIGIEELPPKGGKPMRCYHCHAKFMTGEDVLAHMFADHPLRKISLLHQIEDSRQTRYKTTHYDVTPKDILKVWRYNEQHNQLLFSTCTAAEKKKAGESSASSSPSTPPAEGDEDRGSPVSNGVSADSNSNDVSISAKLKQMNQKERQELRDMLALCNHSMAVLRSRGLLQNWIQFMKFEDLKSDTWDGDESPADSSGSSLGGLNIAQSGPQLTQAEVEAGMKVYEDTFEDYLEMLVQYGYVILFSSAFPMAAMCALLNNIIEIRSDAFKLVTSFQRPFGQAVENIGTWQDALELMSLIAVVVNCALIGMSGLADRMFPNMSTTERIIFIVALEHIILALKMGLAYAIPDVPHWVAEEKARLEFLRREALKKLEGKTISSPTSPAESNATRPTSLLIKPEEPGVKAELLSGLTQRHTTATSVTKTTTHVSPTSTTSVKEVKKEL